MWAIILKKNTVPWYDGICARYKSKEEAMKWFDGNSTLFELYELKEINNDSGNESKKLDIETFK